MTSNVIKLQAPFERLKQYTSNPEVALRKAIILQAIIDSSNSSEEKSAKKIAESAREWLFEDSEYFDKICQEAELEPANVRKIALETIEKQKNNLKNEQIKKGALHLKLLNKHKSDS